MSASHALVVHHHEIGVKGRNRITFEKAMARNVRTALRGTGYDHVRIAFGRIVVRFGAAGDPQEAARRAARLFGTAYVGLGRIVHEPSIDELTRIAVELAQEAPLGHFSIRARRTYSTFEQKTQVIHEHVGRAVQAATGAPVRLKDPDTTIRIELFGKTGILYRDRFEGSGGLPTGTSGRMIVMLSGGIDSPVAAWRIGSRGAEVELLHFHGQPYTDPSSVRQATELSAVLSRYQPQVQLHLVPLGDAQREIVMAAPSDLRTVLYRRMMLRIAALIARERKAKAVVMGDALGQVASQTVENIAVMDAAVPGMTVLRPLLAMTKNEIIEQARRIGTFEISTRKHQDCCVLFQPRDPATRARRSDAEDAEADLDVGALAEKAAAQVETRSFTLGEESSGDP